MKRLNQAGEINVLLFPLVIAVIILIAVAGFGAWAFAGRQDYKENTNEKISAAVTTAKQQADVAKEAEFAERIKEPLKTYAGPAEFGSITFSYPKTWNAYIDSVAQDRLVVNAYFQPDAIPNLAIPATQFALRYQLLDTDYGSILKEYSDSVSQKLVTVSAYQPVKLPTVIGSRLDGQVNGTKKGVMILLPVRDKTIRIWTESDQAQSDFNNFVLPNLSFTP